MDSKLVPATLLTALILGGMAALPNAMAANAQESIQYHISPGSLSQALVQFSLQSGVQLIAPEALTTGLVSSGLNGAYEVQAALKHLLAGSGLAFNLDAERSLLYLYSNNGDDQAHQMNVIVVNGATLAQAGGENGSIDPTATEGTNSYAAPAIRIGSKTTQTVKETPQAISVITQDQMKAQNITDINSAMRNTPGVTSVQSGSMNQQYYSRGWQVTNIQVDGATPTQIGDTSLSAVDMSMYDHVEFLHGGDGLNSIGSSSPGGSINLARKRPLDHSQVSVEAQAGSWNNYRSSVDATAPLGFDGHLRGRAVVTWQDQDFFYKDVNQNTRLVYGLLESDLDPATVLSVGGSYQKTQGRPWSQGLPRLQSGRDAGLSRDTSLGTHWSQLDQDKRELFAQLRHDFNDEWSLSSQVSYLNVDENSKQGALYGAIPDVTEDQRSLYMEAQRSQSEQWLADLNLTGKFDVLSLPQTVSLSASHSKAKSHSPQYLSADSEGTSLDVPEPLWEKESTSDNKVSNSSLVAKVDLVVLPFLPDLHLQTAIRRELYDMESTFQPVEGDGIHIKANENRTSQPYYAVRYDITPDWSVYASYTKIYQYQSTLQTADGSALPPMTGNTKEAGIKYSNGTLNASLAAYRSTRLNLATTLIGPECGALPVCYEIQGGEETSKGIELEVSGEPLPWWSVSFGYTFNRNERKEDGTTASLSSFTPKHSVKLWNDFSLSGNDYLQRTRIGVGVIAQSASYKSGSACAGLEQGDCVYRDFAFTQGFYSVLSSRVSYQLDEHWSLGLNANNLLDRKYYATTGTSESGNWYGEPRNFMLSVNGTF